MSWNCHSGLKCFHSRNHMGNVGLHIVRFLRSTGYFPGIIPFSLNLALTLPLGEGFILFNKEGLMAGKITIGKVAKMTGLSLKANRYYEDKGLLPPRPRTNGGYRQYEEADVNRLLFIRRAKELGISLRQITDLLKCWPENTCSMTRPALKKAMRDRLEELKAQMGLLSDLQNQLELKLSELDKRPFSDHSQGFCNCLGDISGLISIEETGNGNN